MYARLIVCLYVGSEVAILDKESAKGFEFSNSLPDLTLRLNTITEVKNYPQTNCFIPGI